MKFPEFDPVKRKILFFSRGRGRGHAIPDIEIARALMELRPDVEMRFVSYATGAATLAEFKMPLIDLGLPEEGGTAEVSVLAARLIQWLDPDLVISHEEFSAAPAAKIFDKPVLFLTEWFCEPEMYSMHALKFADEILFLGAAGIFEEPSWLNKKVRYAGPLRRAFSARREDRPELRAEFGIPEDSFVVGVFPGSWREEEAPILDLVLGAFDALPALSKRLVWLAGADFRYIQQRAGSRPDLLVIERTWTIDRVMALCDVAVTKTNRVSVYELCQLGIPSIALSYGANPYDDKIVASLSGVLHLAAGEQSSSSLAGALLETSRLQAVPASPAVTAKQCAELISARLERISA